MVYFKDENESYTYIGSEDTDLLYTIMSQLEVYTEGYKFNPSFRAGIWDGKKKFYTVERGLLKIPKGLTPNIIKMLRDKGMPFEYDKIESGDELKISREDFLEFIKSLKIPFEPYDYQINAALDSINNKRLLIRSATGSGKSLIIYLIFRYMYKNDVKCVLVVPTISLTLQMKQDFIDYGWKDAEHIVHLIGGENMVKHFDKPITISTWQSLYKNPHLFDAIGCILIDECLHPDTLIKTEKGDIPIKDIKIGDKVYSYDEENEKIFLDEVVKVHKNISSEQMYEIEMENGEIIKITGNHKVNTKDGWKRVDCLTEEDEILEFNY